MRSRVCTICTKKKDIIYFIKDKRTKLGVGSWCKECTNKKSRDSSVHAKYKYGVTPKEYKKAMSTSKVCEVCDSTTRLCYDHDHTTMKFRGVLCAICNSSLGKLGDSMEAVDSLYKYMRRHYGEGK